MVAVAVLVAPSSALAEARSGAKAKAHYDQGVIEYNLRHFDQAIVEFEQAYRLSPQAVFLFNIAQAHRKAGHLEDAVYFYRRYLSVAPEAAEREDVKKRIAELEELLAKQREVGNKPPESISPPPPSTEEKPVRAEAPPPPPAVTAAEPVATPAPPPVVTAAAAQPEHRRKRVEVVALGGLGLATSGGPTGHSAGPAVTLAVAYAHPLGGLALRLGIVAGLFRLGDTDSTLSFYTLALEPGVRVGAPGARLATTLGLGIGVTSITGLTPASSLLSGVSSVQGAQLALALRPTASVAFRVTELLALQVAAAFCFSPKPDDAFTRGNLTRLELMAGIGAAF